MYISTLPIIENLQSVTVTSDSEEITRAFCLARRPKMERVAMMVRMGRKKPAMTAVFFWIQWVAVLGRSNVRKTPKTKGLRRRWHNFPHLKPTFHDTTCMAKATKERRGCVRLDGSPSTFPEKMSLEQQKSRFSKKKNDGRRVAHASSRNKRLLPQ